MGILYIVATPIGNLEDISARALRVLSEVSLIAAEDTRRTRQLLNHFGIKTPATSYFEHNKFIKLEAIKEALQKGDVALVSDAGTPTINDPGVELVRAMAAEGFVICPIPGASSPIAALSASGLATDAFYYLGYIPRKDKERNEVFSNVSKIKATLIFLESPNRVRDTLKVMQGVFGNRLIVIGRELTKKFEEFLRGSAAELLQKLPAEPLGEMVILVSGYVDEAKPEVSLPDALEMMEERISEGVRVKEASVEISKRTGIDKKFLYNALIQKKTEK